MEKSLTELFYSHGNFITKHWSSSLCVETRRFKSFFGISPSICAKSWMHLKNYLTPDNKEIHLLWALLFLKCYNTESVNSSMVGCDEKTYRKRVWVVIKKLAFIKVVIPLFKFVISRSFIKKNSFIERSNGKTVNLEQLLDKPLTHHWMVLTSRYRNQSHSTRNGILTNLNTRVYDMKLDCQYVKEILYGHPAVTDVAIGQI